MGGVAGGVAGGVSGGVAAERGPGGDRIPRYCDEYHWYDSADDTRHVTRRDAAA